MNLCTEGRSPLEFLLSFSQELGDGVFACNRLTRLQSKFRGLGISISVERFRYVFRSLVHGNERVFVEADE